MQFEIRHVTRYRYDHAVRESVMELWMQPRARPRQRLVGFEIDLEPAAQLFSYADTFANVVHAFDVPQPHDELTIVAGAAVETEPHDPLPEALDPAEWDRLKSEQVAGDCFDFLRPHGFARETQALRAFMDQHRLDDLQQLDPLSAVRRLNETIYGAFGYEAGVTEADSPIDLALGAGRGVCQDFAHIMLAICRSWGLPARYVSGYLFNDRLHGQRSDPDATHAWAEVFLPSLGWVGLDPTNNVTAGDRHIVVAVGRDYRDVPPARGVYKGGGDSLLGVAVTVRDVSGDAADSDFQRLPRPAAPAPSRHGPAVFEHDQLRQRQQQQ